jgi:hypothetical protein
MPVTDHINPFRYLIRLIPDTFSGTEMGTKKVSCPFMKTSTLLMPATLSIPMARAAAQPLREPQAVVVHWLFHTEVQNHYRQWFIRERCGGVADASEPLLLLICSPMS